MAITTATKLILLVTLIVLFTLLLIPNFLRWRIQRTEFSMRHQLAVMQRVESAIHKETGKYSCPSNGTAERDLGSFSIRVEHCSDNDYLISAVPKASGAFSPRAFCIASDGNASWYDQASGIVLKPVVFKKG